MAYTLLEKTNEILEIQPEFQLPSNYNLPSLKSYVHSMESLLKTIIPQNILNDFFKAETKNETKNCFLTLNQNLPLIKHSSIETSTPFCFSISILCFLDFTQGLNKFISDMLNRWLIPGKPVMINGQRSLQFKFQNFLNKTYYLSEYFVNIESKKEQSLIRKNLFGFIKKLKLIILSVQYARSIISKNQLSSAQKSLMIQENISSLLNEKNQKCAYNQMENFLFKLSEEKKLQEIEENLAFLMYKKPKAFDRDLFDSLYITSLLFKEEFTSLRTPKYISKIIAFQYSFQKSIQQIINNAKITKRIVNLKLFKVNLLNSAKTSLGILIAINLLHENEYFEKSYILEALSQIIKNFNYVNNSYIIDKRNEKILSFYLEIEKTDNLNFSLKEITDIKTNLPEKFKERMKNLNYPIVLPRNEEELLRNIIVLSKQLKYVRDLPQVMISYERQEEKKISFLVILLRLIKTDTPSIKELFTHSQTFLRLYLDESKTVGLLKNKYPKEANIFRVSLNKIQFLRRDYSLDLRKARLAVTQELKKVLGEFRDFNGGILIKQCEALESIKKLMPNLKKSNEFLLEDFFYSIRPGIMQSILDAQIIKKFFLLFLSISSQKISKNNFILTHKTVNNNFLVMIKTNLYKCKEDIILSINKLKFKSFELISSSLDKTESITLGYILLSDDIKKKNLLISEIYKCLRN